MIIWVVLIPLGIIAIPFIAVFVASKLRPFVRETRDAIEEAKEKEGSRKW